MHCHDVPGGLQDEEKRKIEESQEGSRGGGELFQDSRKRNSFLLQQETARSFSINVGVHKTYLNDFFQEWKPLGNVPN